MEKTRKFEMMRVGDLTRVDVMLTSVDAASAMVNIYMDQFI